MQIISFEIAKLAKECGFNEDCDNGYNTEGVEFRTMYYDSSVCNSSIEDDWYSLCDGEPCCSAPYQSDLQKWLRDNHGIVVQAMIPSNTFSTGTLSYELEVLLLNEDRSSSRTINDTNKIYSTYEQTLEEGLKESFKLIKNEV